MASDTTEPEAVQTTRLSDGITVVTINRRHRRNAVDAPTAQKLHNAFLAFEADEAQKVLILNGANGTFCAGYDLHSLASSIDSTIEPVRDRNRGPMGPSRLQVKKPVISAVSGHAVAGGLELSLIGDMRVVEEDVVFGVFCRRWGVPLIDGGTVRLPAIVGLGRALDLILTGRPVGAQEALSIGLASRVVPKGKALEEAIVMARQLVAFPQRCMNLDRDSCYHAAYNAASFEDALAFEYRNGIDVIRKESIQGAARFSSGEGRHGSYQAFGKGKL